MEKIAENRNSDLKKKECGDKKEGPGTDSCGLPNKPDPKPEPPKKERGVDELKVKDLVSVQLKSKK